MKKEKEVYFSTVVRITNDIYELIAREAYEINPGRPNHAATLRKMFENRAAKRRLARLREKHRKVGIPDAQFIHPITGKAA